MVAGRIEVCLRSSLTVLFSETDTSYSYKEIIKIEEVSYKVSKQCYSQFKAVKFEYNCQLIH